MPHAPSPAQQSASRANGARAARNGTRHGLRGGAFALLAGEDATELGLLRAAVAADWRPRDAYERHWVGELVAAMWRQQRLRRLELAALAAAEQESPPSEASLKRLVTFARYGARIDKDIGWALNALRVLQRRADADLAEVPNGTSEPEPARAEPHRVRPHARTSEPEPPPLAARPVLPPANPPAPLNRHERRRLKALERRAA